MIKIINVEESVTHDSFEEDVLLILDEIAKINNYGSNGGYSYNEFNKGWQACVDYIVKRLEL